MSNIPRDIKERAERIYAEDLFDGTANYIAYAMMLERQRCAQVAREIRVTLPLFDNEPMNDLAEDVYEGVRDSIAAAIEGC